jgi:uncharacterized membrane protein (UPF0127 family)
VFYKAINRRTGQIIAQRVIMAQDIKSRSVGLLSRQRMGKDEGLLIKPCNSIHTFFMKFAIDVVFLGKDSKVAKIVKDMGPFNLAACYARGYMTLELASGVLAKIDMKIGDLIEFVV